MFYLCLVLIGLIWVGSSLFRSIQNQSKYEIISSKELISEEVIEKTDVPIKIEDPTL